MKYLNFLLIFFFPIFVTAQLSSSNSSQLRQELIQQVNELRISLGVQPLKEDKILKKTAQYQSDYMAENDQLTHTQRKADSSSPSRRVKLMGSNDFQIVGENVLYSSPQAFPLSEKAIIDLATEMFLSWKNSPGHYANMIDPEYRLADFGFRTHHAKKIIYATHVFGKKGYRVAHQLSNNTFKLTETEENCEKNTFSNVLANMGNSILIEGNKIRLYYHDRKTIEQIFDKPKDGLAIDLLDRNQLQCGQPNRLDFSPIFDGVLLPPVYRNELLGQNEAIGNYRFIGNLGTVPDHLQGEDLSASLILIKDGHKCKYLVPGYVPSKRHQLRPINPILKTPNGIKLDSFGIIATQEIQYDFDTNITRAKAHPLISNSPYEVALIKINCYSSVEGDSVQNNVLHHKRANTIKRHIKSKIKVPDSLFNISAQENWPLMDFQLAYFDKDKWLKVSHDSLKQIITEREQSIPWDSLLFAQRRATATIYYQGKLEKDTSSIDIEELNLRTALVNKNLDLANKALQLLYSTKHIDKSFLFETAIFEALYTHPELVQNGAALISTVYSKDIQKTTRFLFKWMDQKEELSADTHYNLLHLYTLTGLYLLDKWEVSSKRLARVIHPDKIEHLSEEISDSNLLLNAHLTFIQYFGQTNNTRKINRSFHHISTYFREHALSPVDDVDLALFFNSWSRYDLSINFLTPKFKNGELNQDGIFLLAQTSVFYPERRTIDLEDLHLEAIEANKSRWCNWLNQDYQILRDHKIKRMYCGVCE